MNETKQLYEQIQKMTFEDVAKMFQSSDEYIKNNNFDWNCLLFKNSNKKTKEKKKKQILKNILDINMDMFSSKNLEKISEENTQKQSETLQKLFFLFIKDLANSFKNENAINACKAAESDNSWHLPSKQTEILNLLFDEEVNSKRKSPFDAAMVDFSNHKDRAFFSPEAVIRLIYNFSGNITKEDIINELNFVREQQRRILPCIVNTKKTNFNAAEAKEEIDSKNKNLKSLKTIDFGFRIKSYNQTILPHNDAHKMDFCRQLDCKVFRETDFIWNVKPYFDVKKHRIIAEKSERENNKNALYKKYLYAERNVFTHSGENYAIRGLFNNRSENGEQWLVTMLQSLFDARKFLLKNHHQELADSLLNMLNDFFEKIIPGNTWEDVFTEEGIIKLDSKQLKKTNIHNVLTELQEERLKDLMKFLYCSSNENEDFIEKNKLTIAIYLTVVSLKLSLRNT